MGKVSWKYVGDTGGSLLKAAEGKSVGKGVKLGFVRVKVAFYILSVLSLSYSEP